MTLREGDKFEDVLLNDEDVAVEAERDYGYIKAKVDENGKISPSPCAASARTLTTIKFVKCEEEELIYDIQAANDNDVSQ